MRQLTDTKGFWDIFEIIDSKFEINSKRCYMPISFDVNCPRCGNKTNVDLDSEYISNPVINDENIVYVFCEPCDDSFNVGMKLKMSYSVTGVSA